MIGTFRIKKGGYNAEEDYYLKVNYISVPSPTRTNFFPLRDALQAYSFF